MPPLVRRTATTILVALTAALVFAGAAAAGYGNGGLTPESSGSPTAHGITRDYYLIAGITFAIFLLVEGLLIAFIFKYRSRGRARSADGYQIHGSTKLELAWTVAPVVILVAIATFVLATFNNIQDVPSAKAGGAVENITVIGHQFYWEFRYPNGAFSIDTMYAPVDRTVKLTILAPDSDVIHSWWIPKLDGKIDAIPGRVNATWFRAPETGTYPGQCAELCGSQHALMKAQVVVQTQQGYAAQKAQLLAQLNGGSKQLGEQMFKGVCEKCHQLSGKTYIGPALRGNPLLADQKQLTDIVHNGRRTMPAVGAGWSDKQIAALTAYTKTVATGGAG
jgi:cytochrome c oxidase subunit 2